MEPGGHSLAVHLLRSGETLKGIGDLLGHRRPDTTFIYTADNPTHKHHDQKGASRGST